MWFLEKKKKKKRLLLCIHYVYLSLAGGGSVLRMNIFVHLVKHTMVPFIAPMGPPVHDRGTVISNPWMLLVLLISLTFSSEAKKKMLFVFFLGILNLLSLPPPLQIITMEGLSLPLWKKGKPCVVKSYLEILTSKSSY